MRKFPQRLWPGTHLFPSVCVCSGVFPTSNLGAALSGIGLSFLSPPTPHPAPSRPSRTLEQQTNIALFSQPSSSHPQASATHISS